MKMGLDFLKVFRNKEPVNEVKSLFAGSKSITDKQPCPNWRCRGNSGSYCVYSERLYNGCYDKGAVNDDFFKHD